MTVFLLLTCVLLLQYLRTNGFLYKQVTCSRVAVLVLSVGHIRRHWWARVSLLQKRCSVDDKTATIQYKPVMSVADNNITNSHKTTIKYHMHYPIFTACTGGVVISLTSYPYTVWPWVSCQAVSPMNGLGTRLIYTRLMQANTPGQTHCSKGTVTLKQSTQWH